jgi:hypothetical protein
MKNKINLIGMILALLVFVQLGLSQSKVESLSSVKLNAKKEELKTVFENPKFLEALSVLVSQAEKIDIKTATKSFNKIPDKKTEGSYEISFDVLVEDGKSYSEYKKLVYSFDGKETIVYFDDENNKFIPKDLGSQNLTWLDTLPISRKQKSELKIESANNKSFCFNWTGWVVKSTYCGSNFGCVFKNQQALYREEEKTCKTNPNNTKKRICKVKCGC